MADAAAPAPNALDQAQQQINAQKAATLAAIAQAGTAGQNAYQAALSGTAADKAQAIQQQLGLLGRINAPQSFIQGQINTLSQPYNNAAANMATQASARQNFLSDLGTTAGTYFNEASAAVPAMQAAAHNALLNANAKLAATAQTQALDLALKQLEYNTAVAKGNNAAANASPFTATTAPDALKALGQTDAERGAALFGYGNQQNAADQAAQVAALAGVTPNPMGFGAAGISAAYPTVNTDQPGLVTGYTTPAAAQGNQPAVPGTTINAYPTDFSSIPGGAGEPSWVNTPEKLSQAQSQAQAQAQINQLVAQLAVLGAAGAPTPGSGIAANATGGFGGMPAISPELAAQLYSASASGRAGQTAITQANTAAAAAAKAAAAPPTAASLKASELYPIARQEFQFRMAAKGATPEKVYAAMSVEHKAATKPGSNGDGQTISYPPELIDQVANDLANLYNHLNTLGGGLSPTAAFGAANAAGTPYTAP